jgi:hypothetical protein
VIERLVWRCAGIVGLAPWPFTARELVWMAEARSGAAWDTTSSLMALLANVHRDAKRRSEPYKPSDFHPHAVAEAPKPRPIRELGERWGDATFDGA